MVEFTGAVGRLVRRMKGVGDAPPAGTAVAAGADAVRAVETLLGVPLDDASGRAGLARALGRAAGGLRAAAFLDGPDALEAQGLFRVAADRRLPLVVHLDPSAGEDPTKWTHDGLHALGASGFILVAADVQEAADFTWIARRVAESVLLPGVVAMDGGTARGAQDFQPTAAARGAAFAGDAAALRHADTTGEELALGRHRRAVPRRVDPERPVATGVPLEGRARAAAVAARRVYFDADLPARIRKTFEGFGKISGRTPLAVTAHRVHDARTVLVAMGTAVGTAEAVADRLRSREGRRVGVLGIRVLQPFPAAEVMGLLRGKEHVLVLERTAGPVAGEPPLTREVRAVLGLCGEYRRHRSRSLRDIVAPDDKTTPRLAAVLYGLGGESLPAADLFALCRELPADWRSPMQLGLHVLPDSEGYPKRRAQLDALRRAHPEAGLYGFRALSETVLPLDPEDAVATVIVRGGSLGTAWTMAAAVLLHGLFGGRVRMRPAAGRRRDGTPQFDRLVHAGSPIPDAGDVRTADVMIWLGETDPAGAAVVEAALGARALLLARGPDRGGIAAALPPAIRRRVAEGRLHLYTIRETAGEDGALRDERLLGGLLGVFGRENLREVNPRKALAARGAMLAGIADAGPRVAAFQAGLDGILQVEAASWDRGEVGPEPAVTVPRRARGLPEGGSPLQSPSRLWDQAAVFHREGDPDAVVPDPVLAMESLPPLAAALAGSAPVRAVLPGFDPAACTGCGTCWTVCPTGAIGARPASPAVLVDVGLRLVREQGGSADALRPVATKLGQEIAKAARAAGFSGGSAGSLIRGASGALLSATKLPEERRAAAAAAAEELAAAWDDFPVARTEVLFDGPDAAKEGTGGLLAVAVDADACTGCMLCVRECEPGALAALPRDAGVLREAAAVWARTDSLPEPDAALVEAMAAHPDAGPLAARMLAAPPTNLPGGASGAEPAPGASIALRQILAAGEPVFTVERDARLRTVGALRGELAAAVRDAMAGGLPTEDLDALAAGLSATEGAEVDLADLMTRVEGAIERKHVDTRRLHRLVTVARDVADVAARWNRAAGSPARGRASLVIDARGADWVGTFPFHPFPDATYVDDTGGAIGAALGLCDAHASTAAADAGVLRRARLVLDGSPQALREADRMSTLGWEDLTGEERRLAPPVVLLGTDRLAQGEGRGRILEAQRDDRRLVVVVLADGGANGIPPGSQAGWIAAAAGFSRVRTAQITPALPDHLAAAAAWVFEAGSGVLRVFAPSPLRAGFSADRLLERAREATATRVFPVFRMHHDPREGLVVDLDGNLEPDADWSVDASGEPLTPVQWALGERRLANERRRPGPGADSGTPLVEFLAKPPGERGRTPVSIVDAEGARWILSEVLLRFLEDSAAAWTLLRRLRRPVRVETRPLSDDDALEGVRRRHEAEMSGIRREYEARLAGLRTEFRGEMATRVRNRLLALLHRGGRNGSGGV